MPVFDRRGKPLPKDHPFFTTTIILGMKPPPGWIEQQRQQAAMVQPADAGDTTVKAERSEE